MTFISFKFYVFLAVIIVGYYIVPLRYRKWVLLSGSMLFYWKISQYSALRLLFLVSMAFICWIFSWFLKKENKFRKLFLVVSVATTAMPLLAVKETPLLFDSIGKAAPEWWIAPIGIAFFSLQMVAYTVDVYRGEIETEKNYFNFLLFVSFFPQILQGPISRYGQLSKQLTAGNKFDERKFVNGFMLILWGFFLKLCIADKAGIIVDAVFDNYPAYRGMYVLMAGVLYSFQLYADFLACTKLTQGIAGLFGIDIIDNFAHPYFSQSVQEFWRRWHISLSSWLRDYIYIPLGGNRKGKLRKYANLLITFAVSGVWHGSGYKFIIWGMIHGVYQILGEILSPVKDFVDRSLNLNACPYLKRACKTLATFVMVMFAWIIFRADCLKTGISMIKSIFTVYNPWILTNDAIYELGLNWKEFCVLIFCLCVLLTVSILQEKNIHIREKILQFNILERWCIYIGVILFVTIFGTYGYGFDSQAFIYGGF